MTEQSQGGTIRALEGNRKGRATVYEAELTVNGRTKDIVDSEGRRAEIEEQSSLADTPVAARAAIEKPWRPASPRASRR